METPEQRIARVAGESFIIAPYDPGWPESFRREKEHLLACLPGGLIGLIGRIEHFGSGDRSEGGAGANRAIAWPTPGARRSSS